MRIVILLLACILSTACSVRMHGIESSGGGNHGTQTSAQVSGAARFSNGAVAFSSGQRVSPGATGGQVSLGKGASGVLVVGLVLVDWVNTIVGTPQPKPLPPGEKIMDTCSCYQKAGNRE